MEGATDPEVLVMQVVRNLRRRLGASAVISDEAIESSVRATLDTFTTARVRSFIPILVEHQVWDELGGRRSEAGRV